MARLTIGAGFDTTSAQAATWLKAQRLLYYYTRVRDGTVSR
jgi:hypothetical protein